MGHGFFGMNHAIGADIWKKIVGALQVPLEKTAIQPKPTMNMVIYVNLGSLLLLINFIAITWANR
jgi:hypothetical protein